MTIDFTTQPVPRGVPTCIRVGLWAHRFTTLNDISTWQQMRDEWLVDAIEVSDTGVSQAGPAGSRSVVRRSCKM